MQCDLCGREKELFKASIEHSILDVCSVCCKYGNVIQSKGAKVKIFKPKIIEEKAYRIVENHYESIKQSREKKGLKQKELASEIGEKVSTIHKIETNNLKLSIKLARKLEKFLGLKLIKQSNIKKIELSKVDCSRLTIGDLLKKS